MAKKNGNGHTESSTVEVVASGEGNPSGVEKKPEGSDKAAQEMALKTVKDALDRVIDETNLLEQKMATARRRKSELIGQLGALIAPVTKVRMKDGSLMTIARNRNGEYIFKGEAKTNPEVFTLG